MTELSAQAAADITPADWAPLVPPIFARCVDPGATRFDLSRPFVAGGFLYATDARICVRTPTPPAWTVPNPARAIPERGVAYFFAAEYQPDPWPLPAVEGVCEACGGAKVMPERACPWCSGEFGGYCEECYELQGRIPAGPCHECYGTGLFDAGSRVEVAPGYYLQRRYVAMLREFDAAAYLPAELPGRDPIRFTVGEAEGVLMAMTPPRPGERS